MNLINYRIWVEQRSWPAIGLAYDITEFSCTLALHEQPVVVIRLEWVIILQAVL